MKKTLFLTAILGASLVAPAMAAEDYTFTGDWTVTEATEVGALTADSGNDNIIMTDDGAITASSFLRFAASWEYSFSVQGGSLNITGEAKTDANANQTLSFTNTSLTLAQGLALQTWNSGASSTVNINNSTVTLGGSIRATVNTGSLNFVTANSTIDVTNLATVGYGDITAPADNANGFGQQKKRYEIADSTMTTTIADGVTVTVKKGDTTLGTLTSSDNGTGLYWSTDVDDGYSSVYYLQDGSTQKKVSDILTEAETNGTTLTSTVISTGNSVLINNADYVGLINSSTGSGDMILGANLGNVTITGTSAVKGRLYIYNGTKLRVGTDQSQTNSISSFSNVDLYGSSVIGRTTKLVLNNVTAHAVTGSELTTSTVKAFDMPTPTTDNVDTVGLFLDGTTTVESGAKLVLMNDWKGRFNVASLTGAGDVEINGVADNSNNFNTTGTGTSDNAMTYTIGINGSGFTGGLTLNNSKATAILKLGDSGALNVSQITKTSGTLQLDGSGSFTTTGTDMLKGGTLADTWTGTVSLSGGSAAAYALFSLGNANSTVAFNGFTGWASNDNWKAEWTTDVQLTDNGDTKAWSNGAFSTTAGESPTATFSGDWSGSGTFVATHAKGIMNYTYSGDISNWKGTFSKSGAGSTTLTFQGDAKTINATISGLTGTLNVVFAGDTAKTANGTIAAQSLTVNEGTLTLKNFVIDTLTGNGKTTFVGNTIGGANKSMTVTGVQWSPTANINVTGNLTLGADNTFTERNTGYYFVSKADNVTLTVSCTANLGDSSMIGLQTGGKLVVDGGALTVGKLLFSSGTTSSNPSLEVKASSSFTAKANATSYVTEVKNAGTITVSGNLSMTGALTNSGTLTVGGTISGYTSVTLSGGTIEIGSNHSGNLTTTALTVDGGTGTDKLVSHVNANLNLSDGKITRTNGGSIELGCTLTLNGNFTVNLSDAEHSGLIKDTPETVSLITSIETASLTGWQQRTEADNSITYFTYATVSQLDDTTWDFVADTDATGGPAAFTYNTTTKTLMVTPEPATATLSLLALAGLCARRRRH